MKRVSRVTGVIAFAAAAMLLAGCGASDATSEQYVPAEQPVAGVNPEGVFEGRNLTFAGYGGTPDEAMRMTLQELADASGLEFAMDSPPDRAKIQAMVESGNVMWDAVIAPQTWVNQMCGELFEPWNFDWIDTSNIPEALSESECAVPISVGPTVFVYNTKLISEKPQSWADFFDTEKFPGKRMVYAGEPKKQLEWALMADGVAPENLYPLDVDRAYAKLETIRDELVFYTTGAEQVQMLEADQAALCACWTGRVYAAMSNGATWDLVAAPPVTDTDVLALVKGSKNADAAHALANATLGAEQSARIQEMSTYPAANVNAKPKLDAVAQTLDVLSIPGFPGIVNSETEFWAENLDELTDRWRTWQNG